MVSKIISGGQTGADIAGLKAAKRLGLETGGWIPQGYRTLDGSRVEYKRLYNLKEDISWHYPRRTEKNVVDSDATLRFAKNFNSPGEICTLKFLKKHHKPYFDVNVTNPPDVKIVQQWIADNNVKVLNVAGNSERTAPGIEEFVKEYLIELLGE